MPLDQLFFALAGSLYVFAFYNCYRILGDRRTPASTLAWILLHIAIPFVAVPIYLLIGGHRLRGYVKRHQLLTEIDESDLDHHENWRRDEEAFVPQLGESFDEYEQIFNRVGAIYRAQPGEADLLVDGSETFEAIFQAIESAKNYIFVQYYILRSDRLGKELQALLIKKQKSGTQVYLLYDDMGSFWLSREYIRGLRKAGVNIARFLPVTSFTRFFQINFRNHRKLVVVDGEVAFTGGLNVGEEYAQGKRGRKKHKRYWRDTHIRVTGRTVKKLEEIFLDDWAFATGSRPNSTAFREEWQAIPHSRESFQLSKNAIRVVPTGPADHQVISVLMMLQLINAAKHRVWIASPYFIPEPSLLRAIELAVLRGVDVKILLPMKGDYRFVQWVSLSYAEEIANLGAKVCLYTAGFIHQKVILVDDHIGAVGTMNFDYRAMYLNFETTLMIHGSDFNARLTKVLQNDFVHSEYFRSETNALRRHMIRVRAGTARLLAPLL